MTPVAAVKAGLEQMRPQFKVSLPSHISAERFERTVLTAMNNNPDLLTADRRSLFNACSKAAQDGLLPDGREGALVIFKDKTGKKGVTWMPMVFGLIKKIRQSGEVDSIGAKIVFQKEIDDGRFEYFVEDGREQLRHKPMLWGDRGEKVLVYSYVAFKSGHVEYLPLHREDVLKRKKASRSKDKDGKPTGPWRDWEDEMWLKTAIRALAKRMPLSSEIMRAIDRDEDPTEFEKLKGQAIQSITDAAAQFAAPAEAETVDTETGEILDVETEEAGESVLAEEAAAEAETPLERGVRLLGSCMDHTSVDGLRASIAEELEAGSDAAAQWEQYARTRRAEIKKGPAL